MSITVTPQPGLLPPRFTIAITSTSGAAITAVTLTRTMNGLTDTTRVQPAPGPSPRTVNDPEAPWNTPVVYTATVTTSSGTETFTSTPATLSPAFPCLIHPTAPALSRWLDTGDSTVMGVARQGTVSRPATTVVHDIIGSKYRVVTSSGPRAASRTQLQIATVTADEQQALWAIVEDQTPLLIRVPASWNWDWEDGYYDVGQVDADRFVQYGAERRRVFTFPLERVEAPAGTQQADRTWADVLTQNGTWNDVTARYATWTDLLTNTRR